jgi:predicted transcriptional regulator
MQNPGSLRKSRLREARSAVAIQKLKGIQGAGLLRFARNDVSWYFFQMFPSARSNARRGKPTDGEQIMKAIIELAPRGSIFSRSKSNLAGRKGHEYRLTFESAKTLFAELTPARIAALDHLRASGPLSIYALAKELGRNYSNVHADAAKLMEHGLVEKDADGKLYVPWDSVEIHLALSKAA